MNNPILELTDVTSGYAQDIDVLKNISLTVHSGQISGLIGLNGAGKSTLVKTICGFITPKTGDIKYQNSSVRKVPAHKLVEQGMVCIPQESSLFPHLTVDENLKLPLRVLKKLNHADYEERIEFAYNSFPILKTKRASQAGDLSGGQQKQLEFAKAWVQRPTLCIIDEPSIGLSPSVASEVFVWIEQFKAENIGVLLIDHNVRRVVQMSDQINVLSLGEITASGTAADFEGDLHSQVRQWLGLDY